MRFRIARKGFTLVELIIVIAIISLLAMLAMPGFDRALVKNRLSEGKSVLLDLQLRVDRYFFRHGHYPESLSEIKFSNTDREYYHFVLESGEGCALENCYALIAQPLNRDRSDELLKLFSNGEREGTW